MKIYFYLIYYAKIYIKKIDLSIYPTAALNDPALRANLGYVIISIKDRIYPWNSTQKRSVLIMLCYVHAIYFEILIFFKSS